MKLFETTRWQIIKQELPAIIVLSILQIYLFFNYDPFNQLRAPWSIFFPASMGVLGIFLINYMLIFSDQFPRRQSYDDGSYEGKLLERAAFLGKAIPTVIFFFIFWYYNLFRTSNHYYVVLYGYWILLQYALKNAVKRNPLINHQDASDNQDC